MKYVKEKNVGLRDHHCLGVSPFQLMD